MTAPKPQRGLKYSGPKHKRAGERTGKAIGKRQRLQVSLETKLQPRQQRALSTYDAILQAAGQLLEEVGVERLSTNLVCKRAGLTPPALYRYFPNKYALLKELGARLMAVQDEAVFAWQDKIGKETKASVAVETERRRLILERVNQITRRFPGGDWVMRALRAVPTLSAVRIASRESVAERDFRILAKRYPRADKNLLRIAATLAVEVMYASTELVMDQPELDADTIAEEISFMTALYLDSFGKPRRKPARKAAGKSHLSIK
ncbi:MAG: TetR/AcrR family transcriptional regulator [Proteobacteria bacterium]|nr:TetR/AcrR family transcriptional regulator [Pseudomonadota bacterium]